MKNILNSMNSSNEISKTINLLDLVELEDLQKIQDAFAIANDIASIITDLNGEPITKASNFCEVCQIVRKTEKGRQNCYKSDKLLGEQAIKTMEPHYEKCHSCGFIDAAAPIIVEGKVIAHWLIGQSNIADVDENRIATYAEEIGADKDEMLSAYKKMSNMSLKRFEKITDLLWLLANEISNKGYTNLKLARELTKSKETEKTLQENIQKLKESEQKLKQKKQELTESQALLNNIIEQAPTGVFAIKAPDMKVFITNKAASEITGLKTDNKNSVTIDNFDFHYKHLYPDRTPYRPEDIPVARVFRNQEIIKNEEMILQFSDGTEKWIQANTSPVYDNNNELIAVTAAFTDITERKKLEEKLIAQNEKLNEKQQELIESQALLNSILEKAPAGILVGKAPDMRICISNQAANEITGQTLEDWSKITNDNVELQFKIHYPDGTPYKDEDLPFIRSFRDQEIVQNEEQLIRLADGTEKSVLISTTPVFDDNNNLTAAVGIFNDITERKKLEKDLLESQALLNSVIEQAPTGVLVAKAPDMELFITNKAANEITGLKAPKWTTITLDNIDIHYENFYPDRTPYKLEDLPLPRAMRDEEVIQNEEILLKLSDGTEKWVSVNASPVYDSNHKLIAATAVFSEITDQKILEEKLTKQNEELQSKEEELIAQNEELQSKEEELLSQNEELQGKEEELISQNEELQKNQKELIESQALMNSIIEQVPTGVIVGKSPDMHIFIINKAAAEISGLSVENWSKINLDELNLNYKSFYPDGNEYKPQDLPLPRAIINEEVIINEETRIILEDGTEKWALVNASPVYDSNNKLIAATAVFSEITDRKKLEQELIDHKNNLEIDIKKRTEELNISLEQLQTTNLHLKQANQHKNRFISSMSHELRTPLNAIIGFTQTLKKQYFGELNEKQMEYINLVKDSGEHLLSLINDILNIAKIDSGSMEFTPDSVNAEKCINDIVSIMAAQFKDKKIHLNYSINDDVDLFYSDERKCKQILFNLLSNALKYTREEGEVTINASKTGDFVNISVIDNGIGIKEENIDKVFQEFYQSDEVRDQALGGVGIGLALTERLVKMHGGEIGVESKVDEGSKFWFTVPAYNKDS